MALQLNRNMFAILIDEESDDLSKIIDKYLANLTASPPQENNKKQKRQPKQKQEQEQAELSPEIQKPMPLVLPDHNEKQQQQEFKNSHDKQGSDEWIQVTKGSKNNIKKYKELVAANKIVMVMGELANEAEETDVDRVLEENQEETNLVTIE
uniref:Uncharacterized protein n=2 Tax=Manihot esculenta TaxID=3983 RepID=A0A2C9V5I1_MANES